MSYSNFSIESLAPQTESGTRATSPEHIATPELDREGSTTLASVIFPPARATRREANSRYARGVLIDLTDRGMTEREKSCRPPNSGDIIGASSGLRSVMRQVQLVAPTEATVLISGESGTGKEVIARAIHDRSARNSNPLVKLNCAAIPESLFESEFFGHVRGAFTGALKDKPGRFELADGGTLFLDEIGEVPLLLQTKLLRVLQEQEFERIGDTQTRRVSVRVIAATNRDLKSEVEAGRFREDLYYRLSVFPIELPPLRNRRDDISLLAAHFIRQSSRRMNLPEPRVTETELQRLASYDWPGNVRELQNAVQRAIILSQGGPLEFELPVSQPSDNSSEHCNGSPAHALNMRDELRRQEKDAIVAALKQTNGKVSGPRGAAELLGMKPSTLASRMTALGLR